MPLKVKSGRYVVEFVDSDSQLLRRGVLLTHVVDHGRNLILLDSRLSPQVRRQALDDAHRRIRRHLRDHYVPLIQPRWADEPVRD